MSAAAPTLPELPYVWYVPPYATPRVSHRPLPCRRVASTACWVSAATTPACRIFRLPRHLRQFYRLLGLRRHRRCLLNLPRHRRHFYRLLDIRRHHGRVPSLRLECRLYHSMLPENLGFTGGANAEAYETPEQGYSRGKGPAAGRVGTGFRAPPWESADDGPQLIRVDDGGT